MDDTLCRILPLTVGAEVGVGVRLDAACAREVSGTLEPLPAGGEPWRDVNGTLHWSALPGWRKYKLTLSASDVLPPPLAGVWPGMPARVEVAAEMLGASAVLLTERTAVSGSARTVSGHPGGALYAARYRLDCRLLRWSCGHDEWSADHSWSLEFEEI